MGKILTIVVPSYNTEKYINECLPTMLNIKEKACLELLLIDDGSKDATLMKLKKYEENYPDTIRVIHKENGGHGSVINCGIREATGKYFKVIDGDDWVDSAQLNHLIEKLSSCDEDLILNQYIRYNETNGKQRLQAYSISANKVVNFEEFVQKEEKVTIHSATFKTSLLKDNCIEVREKCFYEDAEYVLYPLIYVKTLVYYDFPVYMYRVGSLTQSVNPKQALKNRKMHELIVKDCIGYFKKNEKNMSADTKKYYESVVITLMRTQYNIFLKNKLTKEQVEELVMWDKEMKKEALFFYEKTNNFPISVLRKNIKANISILGLMSRIYLKICKR